jgi:hypothetical protein
MPGALYAVLISTSGQTRASMPYRFPAFEVVFEADFGVVANFTAFFGIDLHRMFVVQY